jgi:hypothetical protein
MRAVAERVVVSFHGKLPSRDEDRSPSYLSRALALKKRADALGATLCAWSGRSLSFDFGADEFEKAVSLALWAAEEPVADEHRFGAGVADGELELTPEGSLGMLAWGRPLVRSEALARIALPGEVLLDPALPAARARDLLTTGARVSVADGARVRGLRLDPIEPWRHQAMLNVVRLAEPPLVGCDGVFELAMPLGSLGVVRAAPGAGGSRLLAEWTDRLAPWRVLVVTPVGAAQEPLGAIRCALSRSAAVYGVPPLAPHLRVVLDALLLGDGADPWAVAELLDAWLGSAEERSGVLAVDDASDVDAASLEAIASSISVRGRFRMLARVEVDAPVPEPFASIPAGPALVVGPLARENAERLGAAFTGGAISDDALSRWARIGGSTPLALREALAEGIASGDLCWAGDVAVPRRRAAGRGRAASAHEWIARRARRAMPEERAVLTALAMLGGDVSDVMTDELASVMYGPAARVADLIDGLASAGWLMRPEPGWTKLRSRTARDALVSLVDPAARKLWHEAAARTIVRHGGALGRAEAAWHAAQAGDGPAAAALALEAARAARAAALDPAASSLVAFARAQDPAQVADAPDLQTDPPARETTPSEPMAFELEAPFELDDPSSTDALLLTTDDLELDDAGEPEDSNLATTESPALALSHMLELAKEAWLQRDYGALEGIVVELKRSGRHRDLAERLGGFAALGRGAKAEALRVLHAAASDLERSRAERARALLAHGIALAAAGHAEGALLQALEALSMARAARDRRGERACSRFLARLSHAAGHVDAARIWESHAQGAVG